MLGSVSCKTFPAGNFASNQSDKDGKSGADQKEEPLPLAQSFQIPIGTVHMVDKGGKFVLIKSNRSTTLEPETKIISYGANAQASAQLKVSPARKGAYLTADLVEGIPMVGDLVMIVHSMSKTKTDDKTSPMGFPSNVQILE